MKKEIAEVVKNKRLEKKLSQEQLGKLIGVSKQAVQKWEAGVQNPSFENYVSLSKILDFSLNTVKER